MPIKFDVEMVSRASSSSPKHPLSLMSQQDMIESIRHEWASLVLDLNDNIARSNVPVNELYTETFQAMVRAASEVQAPAILVGQAFRELQNQIQALRALLPDAEPSPEIVDLTLEVSAELIKYLAKHPEALYEIKPRQFEELIAEILTSYGWQVNLTPATRDGGYDLFAISRDKAGVKTSWIIECKKYRHDRKVGIDVARALYGVRGVVMPAGMMMLATTSYFSSEVHEYKASRYDLELRDYEGILEWLNEYKPNPNGRLYIKDNRLVVPGET